MRKGRQIALRPRSSIPVPVSPCVFYKLHENTGGTCSDALGNGPDLTLAASGTGTPWSDTGWVTPDGTNHYLNVASSAYLQNLLRFDTAWEQMLLAFDYKFDGDLTWNEAFLSFGRNDLATGMFALIQSGGEQLQVIVRGKGASAATTNSLSGTALTTFGNTRLTLLFELARNSDNTFDVNVYKNGVAFGVSGSAYSWLLNGATEPWGAVEGGGYTLGARNGAASKDILMGSAASTAMMGRFFAMRRSTRDATLAAELALELFQYQGEIPLCIDGK